MSPRKKSKRSTRHTRSARNSSKLPFRKHQIKACKVNLTRLNIQQILRESKVDVIRLDRNKLSSMNSKQSGTNSKQTDNVKNKQSSKKPPEKLKSAEENKIAATNIVRPGYTLNLRHRKLVKYAESSLEMSKCEDRPNKQKVPVYKQEIKNEKSTKRKTDQYEFDSDSEKRKKMKRGKLEDSSTEEYHAAVKKIVNGTSKTKKKNKNIIFSSEKTNIKQKKSVQLKKQIGSCNKVHLNNVHLKVTANKKKITEQNAKTNNATDKIVHKRKGVTILNENDVGNAVNEGVMKSGAFKTNQDLIKKVVPSVEDKENVIDNNNDQEYFGFTAAELDTSPKINIISNIQLKPREEWNVSLASPRLFKDGKPNANSTMIHNILTPWRFNEINIRRNPHFITLKQSSLPCINQEMVLDYTIVDKCSKVNNQSLSSEVDKKKVERPQIQTKMDHYISSNVEKSDNYENELSLFDIDQFSPIKCRTRSFSKNLAAKRKICEGNTDENILKDISNENTVQSPAHKSNVTDHANKKMTDFGFNSVDDYSDKENSPKQEKNDKPFRLSINLNDKKYGRKKKFHISKEESVVGRQEESDIEEPSDIEDEDREIKLFEDCDDTREFVKEEKVVKRKKRRFYNQDNDLEKPKRRKDIRSKEEEEEAERWATAFNSMCEEIDRFPLEIE